MWRAESGWRMETESHFEVIVKESDTKESDTAETDTDTCLLCFFAKIEEQLQGHRYDVLR